MLQHDEGDAKVIDRSFIGYEMEPFEAPLEIGQMTLFARALGEQGSIYVDEKVALAQGFSSIVALPTFLICLGTREDLTYGLFDKLGIELSKLLHGEQEFFLERTVCAGEILVGRKKVVDIYDKKDGALEFVVTEISYHDQHERFVGSDRCTFVIKNK